MRRHDNVFECREKISGDLLSVPSLLTNTHASGSPPLRVARSHRSTAPPLFHVCLSTPPPPPPPLSLCVCVFVSVRLPVRLSPLGGCWRRGWCSSLFRPFLPCRIELVARRVELKTLPFSLRFGFRFGLLVGLAWAGGDPEQGKIRAGSGAAAYPVGEKLSQVPGHRGREGGPRVWNPM